MPPAAVGSSAILKFNAFSFFFLFFFNLLCKEFSKVIVFVIAFNEVHVLNGWIVYINRRPVVCFTRCNQLF